MKTPPDLDGARRLRLDVLKLFSLILAIFAVAAVFVLTPSLSTSTLFSVVVTLFLSPMVAHLERRGFSRMAAIGIIFLSIGLVFGVTAFWTTQSVLSEWNAFSESAPRYFEATIAKLRLLEGQWKSRYPFLADVQPTETLMQWGHATGQWFISNGAGIMGQVATCLLVVPLLTFGLLKDGITLKKKIFEMVPNRFFESGFMITSRIMSSLSDYIRAKLIEALLVGMITWLGMAMIHSPYAFVLGVIAGVTNILPYIGPVIGAVPGLLIAAFDTTGTGSLLSVGLVYVIANVVDMAVIFPVVVAKLVNLHPIVLVIVVMLGQNYYGLIGMLISIPVATGVKIIFQEVYSAVAYPRDARVGTSG